MMLPKKKKAITKNHTHTSTPLMQRTVCGKCKHMHREIMADICECCKNDGKTK